jgi:hypothetical protein
MIGEILTAAFAAATGGYLWARARHYRGVEKSKGRIKAIAGISQQTKNNDSNEPYWWQKYEHKDALNPSKFPETQEELEKHLEIQRQELKRDEMIYYLDQEKRKEYEAQRKKWEEGNAEWAKQMLASHKKKEEEGS